VTVRIDPEGNETAALFALADIDGAEVLEVGCGDGRLTFRYAERAGRVTAIEPFAGSLARARERLSDAGPAVEFRHASFEDFAAGAAPDVFDVTLLSWSLC
jgi:ubiquinone/menaquinone biosynthesis C-methylase UbiE